MSNTSYTHYVIECAETVRVCVCMHVCICVYVRNIPVVWLALKYCSPFPPTYLHTQHTHTHAHTTYLHTQHIHTHTHTCTHTRTHTYIHRGGAGREGGRAEPGGEGTGREEVQLLQLLHAMEEEGPTQSQITQR